MQNDASIFQLHTDFVSHPTAILHILVQTSVADISSTLKLFEHVRAPNSLGKYHIAIDDQTAFKYFATNQNATLCATLNNLEECNPKREIYICNDMSILKKVGKVLATESIAL